MSELNCNKLSNETYNALATGLQILAGACDGAIRRDNVGFAACHTHRGRYLAGQAQMGRLHVVDQIWAARALQDYRNTQLPDLELPSFDDVLAELEIDKAEAMRLLEVPRRAALRESGVVEPATVELQDGEIQIRWPRRHPHWQTILDAVRTLSKRRFENRGREKYWTAPVTIAAEVVRKLEGMAIDIAPEVLELAAAQPEAAPAAPDAPAAPEVVIKLVNGKFAVFFEPGRQTFRENLAKVKSLPERKFRDVNGDKFWEVPTRLGAQLMELFPEADLDPKVERS